MERMRLGLFQIFQNDRGFEDRDRAHLQNRSLPERRYRYKPFRLIGEIDIDTLEWDRLFRQRDDSALHIRAQLVADQFQSRGHPNYNPCTCMQVDATASNCQDGSAVSSSLAVLWPGDNPTGHGYRHAGCGGIAQRQAFQAACGKKTERLGLERIGGPAERI